MKKWVWVGMAVTSLGILGGSFTASALAEKKVEPAKVEAENDGEKTLETIAFAHQLAELGRANQKPELLLLAARQLHQIPTEKLKAETEGGTEVDVNAYSPAELVADARKMPSDKLVASLLGSVADELKEKPRGVVGGAQTFGPKLLEAKKSSTYTYKLVANKQANILVQLTPNAYEDAAKTAVTKANTATNNANSLLAQYNTLYGQYQATVNMGGAAVPGSAAATTALATAATQNTQLMTLSTQISTAQKKATDSHTASVKAASLALKAKTELGQETTALAQLLTNAQSAATTNTNAATAFTMAQTIEQKANADFSKDPKSATDPILNMNLDTAKTNLSTAAQKALNASAASTTAQNSYSAAKRNMKVSLLSGSTVVQSGSGPKVHLSYTPKVKGDYSIRVENVAPGAIVFSGHTN